MIVLSAVLVLVGLALLIAGLVSTGLALIYASLGVTVVAAILLLLGVRMSPSKRGGDVSAMPVAVSSAPASQQAAVSGDAHTGELEPVAVDPVVADAGRGTVVVVSGRPRYHRTGCRFLANAADEAEDISAEEARELGFTPCGVCKPDDQHGSSADGTDAAASAGRTQMIPTVTPDESTVAAPEAVGARPDSQSVDSDETAPPSEAPAQKAAAKKAAAKKTVAKTAPAKKAPAKKTVAKKAAAKKAPAKKTAAKKAPAKKTAAKKAPAKAAVAKKAPGRRTSGG